MKNRIPAVSAFILAALLFSPSAWAWGRIGHRVAAMMAEERLSSHALAAIHDLLGPGVTLANISTWADEQRDPKTAPWHYVDVPITEFRYNPRYCQPGGCVVSKIEDFKCVLQDPRAGRPRSRKP